MNFTQKQKRARELRANRARGQAEGLAKTNDWKSRRAKEAFRRPAFQGTELEKKDD